MSTLTDLLHEYYQLLANLQDELKNSEGLISDAKKQGNQKKSRILMKEQVKQVEQAQQHLVQVRQRTEKLLATYRNANTDFTTTSKEPVAPSDSGDVGELSASIETAIQELRKLKVEIDDEEQIRRALLRRIRKLVLSAVVVITAFGGAGFLVVNNSGDSADEVEVSADFGNVNEDSIATSGAVASDLAIADLLSRDAGRIAQALNCRGIDPFAVKAPATSGFTCNSDGRSVFPLSIFVYAPDQEVPAERQTRACEKALELGQPTVYVIQKEGIFVYTTSIQAVEASAAAPFFRALESQTCNEIP